MKPDWKLCSEEMPEEEGTYLTYWSDGALETFPFEGCEVSDCAITLGNAVMTHWAELPEGPEGAEEKQI